MCDSCEVLNINGINCHEYGCPDVWKDYPVECFECGCEFMPTGRFQGVCEDCGEAYEQIGANKMTEFRLKRIPPTYWRYIINEARRQKISINTLLMKIIFDFIAEMQGRG